MDRFTRFDNTYVGHTKTHFFSYFWYPKLNLLDFILLPKYPTIFHRFWNLGRQPDKKIINFCEKTAEFWKLLEKYNYEYLLYHDSRRKMGEIQLRVLFKNWAEAKKYYFFYTLLVWNIFYPSWIGRVNNDPHFVNHW